LTQSPATGPNLMSDYLFLYPATWKSRCYGVKMVALMELRQSMK
jgi:hypothetical protein